MMTSEPVNEALAQLLSEHDSFPLLVRLTKNPDKLRDYLAKTYPDLMRMPTLEEERYLNPNDPDEEEEAMADTMTEYDRWEMAAEHWADEGITPKMRETWRAAFFAIGATEELFEELEDRVPLPEPEEEEEEGEDEETL